MSENRRDSWALYVGIGLMALGVILLIERVFGPVFEPIRQLWSYLPKIGWPIALILLGVLIILGVPQIRANELRGKRIYRSRDDKMLSGLLGGLAHYLGVDPTWVRLAYVLFTAVLGFWPGLVLYVIGSIIVPVEPFQPGVQSPPPAPPSA